MRERKKKRESTVEEGMKESNAQQRKERKVQKKT